MADNTLSVRLKKLVEAGIFERRPYDKRRNRFEYLKSSQMRCTPITDEFASQATLHRAFGIGRFGGNDAMAKVVSDMSMSLDGFVVDPSDEVRPLFDWYGNSDGEVPTADPERRTFRTSEASAQYLRESMEKGGAIVAGLLDEVRVNLVAVLLGRGIQYFDNLSSASVALEGPTVIQGTGVTHLCCRLKVS